MYLFKPKTNLMNVPNSFGRDSVVTLKQLKSFMIGFFSLLVFSVVSVNDAVAQTPAQLGEKLTDQMLYRFKAEHQFLEAEMKNPPAGINVSKNGALVRAYANVEKQFKEGGNLIQLLSGVISSLELSAGNSGNTPSWGTQGGNDQFTQDQGFLVEELESVGVIESVEDLDSIFETIRALKNQ